VSARTRWGFSFVPRLRGRCLARVPKSPVFTFSVALGINTFVSLHFRSTSHRAARYRPYAWMAEDRFAKSLRRGGPLCPPAHAGDGVSYFGCR